MLVYVDYVLACSQDEKAVIAGLAANFEIKNYKIAEPKLYLGGNVEKFQLPNGNYTWIITYNSYVKSDIDTVQRLLVEDVRTLKTGNMPHKRPLPHGYNPELDTTDECDAEYTSRYQQLIGILRWAVDLGRIRIKLEVALMSQYQINTREGHLKALYLIFHFLWNNPKKRQVIEPSTTMIYESVFHSNSDWVEFYGDVAEEDLPQMPELLGEPVSTSIFLTMTMLQMLPLGDHIQVYYFFFEMV